MINEGHYIKSQPQQVCSFFFMKEIINRISNFILGKFTLLIVFTFFQLKKEDFDRFDYMFAFDNYIYEACLAIKDFTAEKFFHSIKPGSYFRNICNSKELFTIPNHPNNHDDDEIDPFSILTNKYEMELNLKSMKKKVPQNVVGSKNFKQLYDGNTKKIIRMDTCLFEEIEAILA